MESAEKMRGEVSYGIHTYLELNDAKAAAGTKDIVLPVYIPANKLVTFGWAPGGASPLAAVSQEIIIGADITRDMMVMGKLIDLPPFSTKFASKLTRMVKYSNSRPQQAVPLQFKLIC
jgi:hypothetical protein